MTKKLLFLLDTDPAPSVFDTVVGYDGGADHVIGYGGVTLENVGALVDGTIYTRGPKEKQCTAIFVGGSNMQAGEAVFDAVKKHFFSSFRVSAMLDSNGSNTTAAAAVALLAKAKPLSGQKGRRARRHGTCRHAGGRDAAHRRRRSGDHLAFAFPRRGFGQAIAARFGFTPTVIEAADNEARASAIKGAQVVLAAGAIGVSLLDEKDWQSDPTIELIADCNAQPPLGVGGVDAVDKAKERHGKIVIGALGLGGLKLKLHRECIGALFNSADQIFDAENIYAQAKLLA